MDDFAQSGLYLLLPKGQRIELTHEKIEAFAQAFESNLHLIPAEIRAAVAFKACSVCPEKDRFCHALPPTLAFFKELEGYKSFDPVDAIYKSSEPGLILVPNTTMQVALQYVVIYSLMYYCEIGKKYYKYFLGTHPLMSTHELTTRIHCNIYFDCRGDRPKINQVMETFSNEITCTCRCQVKRLQLVCKNDALINAFTRTQAQIELLVLASDEQVEVSFEDFMKNG